MGDDFRPPSLAPFIVGTELAPLRERETGSRPAKLRARSWPVLTESSIAVVRKGKILRGGELTRRASCGAARSLDRSTKSIEYAGIPEG